MATTEGTTVARNYAEALLALAQKAEDASGWGAMLRQVANAIGTDVKLRRFLESPRIDSDVKINVLSKALSDRVPRHFMRYLEAVVRNRRQMLLPAIANEYDILLDEQEGVVHAKVLVAHPMSDSEQQSLGATLTKTVGRRVIPDVVVEPSILGGIIVRVGDTVMDGSVRRKLNSLRRQLHN